MSDKRILRIFCPIHEAAFEAADTPKILCEITGHALSTDFPNGEAWEFCCNCQTFSPSKLGKGEKARSKCFSCQNEISKRFVCSSCQTLSFECSSKSRGQSHFVSDVGIAPACPGCQIAPRAKVIRHDCKDIDAEIVTAHVTCPFCLEATATGFVMPQRPAAATAPGVCPNCHAINPVYALFCGKCKHPIRIAGVASMPDITHAKTELPGIICSNCSTPVPPDYDFCAECGKAVNGSPFVPPPPPPPPPPSSKSGNSANSFTASMDAGKETYAAKNIRSDVGSLGSPEAITSILKDPTFKIIAFAVGGIVLFGILVAAISSGTKSTVLSSNPANTTKPTPVIAGTPNSSNSDYRIRKNGTLTRDVNLRQYAGKDYRSDGIQYRGARVTILDVTSVLDVNGESFEWFKVQITSYGRSMDANNGDRSKDPGSLDVGWIHSYPNISQTKSVNRVVTVNIDN